MTFFSELILLGELSVMMFIAIWFANTISKRLDTYRNKYGFDEQLESKWFKTEKQLQRAKSKFLKRQERFNK